MMKIKIMALSIVVTAMLSSCGSGSSRPTLDPQRDAEQLVREQLEIMNSDRNPREGIEAIQESAHKYTEAYEKAGMHDEFMEMTRLATELQNGKYQEDFDKAHQRIIERYGGN